MPYIGKTPTVGNFQVCDAISVVNGQAAYTLQVGGANVAPESANHMLVSLNGVLQKPGSSFTISGSTMTFASNLATGDVIDFVQILGNVLDLGSPSDDTVTAAKLNNDIISGTTALTSAPDDTDELLISDAGTLKRIDYSLIKAVNTPSFHVTQSSSQSFSNATTTKITYDTELYDVGSGFNTSNNNFTVPSGEGGKYVIGIRINAYFYSDKAWQFMQNLYINGSERIELGVIDEPSNDNSRYGGTSTECVVLTLAAGDTIVAQVYGNTRGNANFQISGTGSARKSSYFYGYKLIGL